MENKRAYEIDGIRGWAALCVLLFHLFGEVFRNVLPAAGSWPISPFLNGPLAVYVFFVLSGDALSIAFVRSRQQHVINSLLVRRYFRLMVPVVMACAVVYLLMKTGSTFNRQAGVIVGREDWLGSFLHFEPTFRHFTDYVLLDAYSPNGRYSSVDQAVNPMLWTMAVELRGSGLVFLFWYCSTSLRFPKVSLAVAGLFFFGVGSSFFSLFFAGMLLSEARASGALERLRVNGIWQILSPMLALVLLFVMPHTSGWPGEERIRLAGAASLVLVFYTSQPLRSFFSGRLSRFLGDISFPLYLIHFATIVSFTSWWIVHAGTITPTLALWISTVSALLSIIAAVAFRKVERTVLARIDHHLLRLIRPSRGVATDR